jgi:hypothetical protein
MKERNWEAPMKPNPASRGRRPTNIGLGASLILTFESAAKVAEFVVGIARSTALFAVS